MTEQNIEYNYYPISIALAQSSTEPQVNNSAVALSDSNVIPTGNGSVVAGGMIQSPNYVKNTAGWKINSDGSAEFQSIIAGSYITVFRQDGIPTSQHINDIWIDTNDSNKMYVALCVGADQVAAGEWVLSNPATNWSTVIDDDGNKPADNATLGATFGTDIAGGGSADNQIGNDGYVDNLKAQHIIAPSDFTTGDAQTAGDALYFKASDLKVYKADADADESTYNFIGFARYTKDAAATDQQVITGGIITKAAWGLTAGSWYYISATAGAVTATPATRVLEVGIAISATELLIVLRKPRTYAGTVTITGVATLTITCGFRPSHVVIEAISNGVGYSHGFGNGLVSQCLYHDNATAGNINTTKAWFYDPAGDVYIYGVIDTFSSTGFRFNQENVGTGTSTIISYMAFG